MFHLFQPGLKKLMQSKRIFSPGRGGGILVSPGRGGGILVSQGRGGD